MRNLPRFVVLTAIDLNHQPRRQTNKIRKIRSERKLATKAQTVDLLSAKRLPKPSFCVRHAGAKLA
jgi:hypothetical protein